MIAIQHESWRDACNEVVERQLTRYWPEESTPVDAIGFARRMGVEVVFDESMRTRARFKRFGGSPTIFLRPEERPERLQWAVAHELGERLAQKVFEQLGQDSSETHTRQFGGLLREQVANEVAGRLLLPRRTFLGAIERFDGDLLQLKREFPTASHELILLGMLRWPDWSVVTVFDNQEVTRRFGNHGRAPRMTPAEFDVWSECHRTATPCDFEEGGVRIQAWPVHENDWKRELLRATRTDDVQEIQQVLFDTDDVELQVGGA